MSFSRYLSESAFAYLFTRKPKNNIGAILVILGWIAFALVVVVYFVCWVLTKIGTRIFTGKWED